MTIDDRAWGLLVAALGGAAVGLERQWSGHADGPTARFAGIRTFTLLGLIGGVAGRLSAEGLELVAVALVTGAVALAVVGYVAAATRDVDGTTEVAAIVVVGAGVVAGHGQIGVAGALAAVTALLLAEKSRLHELVMAIDDVGMRAGLRFAVLALVVLPVLPTGPFGPLGGVRPQALWTLVLFFSGLSFAGYLARRLAGDRHGLLMAGALGGLISSTNVTLTFARTSRTDPTLGTALGLGAIAASAVLYPRVLLALVVLNPPLAGVVAPYLVAPCAVAAGVTWWASRRHEPSAAPVGTLANPLQLGAALQMALVFQVVLMIIGVVRDALGRAGLVATGALLGLTDVDALTVSMARGLGSAVAVDQAAEAIVVGILANTLLKLVVAVTIGHDGFRSTAGGVLAAMAALTAAGVAAW